MCLLDLDRAFGNSLMTRSSVNRKMFLYYDESRCLLVSAAVGVVELERFVFFRGFFAFGPLMLIPITLDELQMRFAQTRLSSVRHSDFCFLALVLVISSSCVCSVLLTF